MVEMLLNCYKFVHSCFYLVNVDHLLGLAVNSCAFSTHAVWSLTFGPTILMLALPFVQRRFVFFFDLFYNEQ